MKSQTQSLEPLIPLAKYPWYALVVCESPSIQRRGWSAHYNLIDTESDTPCVFATISYIDGMPEATTYGEALCIPILREFIDECERHIVSAQNRANGIAH